MALISLSWILVALQILWWAIGEHHFFHFWKCSFSILLVIWRNYKWNSVVTELENMLLCFSVCGSSRVRSLSYWVMPTGYILWKKSRNTWSVLRFALIFQKVWSNSDRIFSSWECQNAEQTRLDPENLFPPNLSVLLMAFRQEFIPKSKPSWVEVGGGGRGVMRTLKKSLKKMSFAGCSPVLGGVPSPSLVF